MSTSTPSDLEHSSDNDFALPPAKRRRRSSDYGDQSADEDRLNSTTIAASMNTAPTRITRKPQTQLQQETRLDSPPPLYADGYKPPTLTSTTFAALDVHPWLTHALSSLQIHHPTRIQQTCVPAILGGQDVIGGSRTGTGKTLAFAVPILQKWAEDPFGIYALILTPTRELALQIYEQFVALGASQALKVVLVTGGTEMRPQANALEKRPHIVVATPGRLADHVQRSGEDTVLGLRRTKVVVFDEADRLLSSSAGMLPDINTCLSALPPANDRLTLLFTATVTAEVRSLKDKPRPANKPPIFISEITDTDQNDNTNPTSNGTSPAALLPPNLTQTYIQTPLHQAHKESYLLVLLMHLLATTESQIIIFANRTATANHLHYTLTHLFTDSATIEDFLTTHNKTHPTNKLDVGAKTITALHSELAQKDRARNLSAFRAQTARILICTDLVSRGLDVPGVGHVINFDLPRDPVDYVHRVGRTARAGRRGVSICLVGPRDVDLVLAVEEYVGGSKMEAWEAPGVNIESRVVRGRVLKDVGEARLEALRDIESGKLVGGGGYRKKMKKDRKRVDL